MLTRNGMLGLAIALAAAAATVDRSGAEILGHLDRTGRLVGAGWGDGYHACQSSGFHPGADLPPKPYSRSFGRPPHHQHCGLRTFYDRFDARNHPHRPGTADCGGTACDACDSDCGCDVLYQGSMVQVEQPGIRIEESEPTAEEFESTTVPNRPRMSDIRGITIDGIEVGLSEGESPGTESAGSKREPARVGSAPGGKSISVPVEIADRSEPRRAILARKPRLIRPRVPVKPEPSRLGAPDAPDSIVARETDQRIAADRLALADLRSSRTPIAITPEHPGFDYPSRTERLIQAALGNNFRLPSRPARPKVHSKQLPALTSTAEANIHLSQTPMPIQLGSERQARSVSKEVPHAIVELAERPSVDDSNVIYQPR